MLKKKSRADTTVVEKIFKEGRFINSLSLSFKFIHKSASGPARISFIVPKNIAKLATRRNFLRRHGYDALKKSLHLFPTGTLGVFIYKKYQDDVSVIENEIKNISDKIH